MTQQTPTLMRYSHATIWIYILFVIISIAFSQSVQGQNVGIGVSEFTPHNSALLELRSDNKGILIPRMTVLDRISISEPAVGLLVFQTDNASGFYYFSKQGWLPMGEQNSAMGIEKGFVLEGSVDNPNTPPTDLNNFPKIYYNSSGAKRTNFHITTNKLTQPVGNGKYCAWAFPQSWGGTKVYISNNTTDESDFHLLYDCWKIYHGVKYHGQDYTVYVIDVDIFKNSLGLFFQFK